MEEGVLQRVISICRQKSVSESQFAKMIGSNQKTINQQLRGERSISLDTISKILSSFEDISSEWLLRGEGDMLKPQPTSPYLESKTNKTSAPHQIETKNIKVPVVPVGIACASRKTINPLNGAERNGWLRNEKRTLVVPTVTPVLSSRGIPFLLAIIKGLINAI